MNSLFASVFPAPGTGLDWQLALARLLRQCPHPHLRSIAGSSTLQPLINAPDRVIYTLFIAIVVVLSHAVCTAETGTECLSPAVLRLSVLDFHKYTSAD